MIVHAPESRYAQERSKWEWRHSWDGIPPNPNLPQYDPSAPENRYPRMLYKAGRPNAGPVQIVRHIIAGNEAEEAKHLSDGWHPDQQSAIDAVLASDQEKAKIAAARNYEDRNMGERARAEAREYESQTSEHVAEVPTVQTRRQEAEKRREAR